MLSPIQHSTFLILSTILYFLSAFLVLSSRHLVFSFSSTQRMHSGSDGKNSHPHPQLLFSSPSPMLLSQMPIPVRVELFLPNRTNKKKKKPPNGAVRANKDDRGLVDRIRLFEEHGITSFNIVNKDKTDKDSVVEWIETIRNASLKASNSTDVHVCSQFSLLHNRPPKTRNLRDQRKEHLLETLKKGYFGAADEILLVSGSGTKPLSSSPCSETPWNTADGIDAVNDYYENRGDNDVCQTTFPHISVSYNPYLSDPHLQDQENSRLERQLATGCLSKIYLPFGTDLDRLRTGLEFCADAIHTAKRKHQRAGDVSLVGSFVLPTPRWMAHQRKFFRSSQKRVMLDPRFFKSDENQELTAIVVQVIRMYEKHGFGELLLEASPSANTLSCTKDDLSFLFDILKRVSASRDDGLGPNRCNDSERSSSMGMNNFRNNSNGVDFSSNSKGTKTGAESSQSPEILKKSLPSSLRQDWRSRSSSPCILLFGSHDVRLQDNKALEAAARSHKKLLPVFLWTKEERDGDQWGCPRNTAVAVCLEEALKSLQDSLQSFGLPLIYCNCCGPSPRHDSREEQLHQQENSHGIRELKHVVEAVGATAVYWNKDPTPEGRDRDAYRRRILEQHRLPRRIDVFEAQSSLLYDVSTIELPTGFRGGHFGTLMPFLNHCRKQFGVPSRPTPYFETFRILEESSPPEAFDTIFDMHGSTMSTHLRDLKIIDTFKLSHKWDQPIRARFPMSEKIAQSTVDSFVRNGMKRYETDRSRADISDATSRLSPHLRIGTMSPNQLYWRIEDSELPYKDTKTLGRRLIWRDLAYFQLHCFPSMKKKCIRSHYEAMEWVETIEEDRRFRAWKTGTTGYPIVDAAMRELYATGWMTQSIRMVAASFLTEYLRINWTKGAEWFHHTLVDADSAINAMMWQNAGRSGIDQWNFVLSPTTASQDPTGAYTRRWVPELAELPTNRLVHCPWEATEDLLEEHGVVLGETYPHRIVVDLKKERKKSVENTLAVRRAAQDYNTDRGYDMIDLPNGQKSIVFTKKEYRIDRNGNVLPSNKSNGNRRASNRMGNSRTGVVRHKKSSRNPKKAKTST
ncbi:unnamed protein product [Pseudo-nitzschia multistriata]|uniref:Photolyase/cryptochrome alpha/beta domain-containing protein n=1 Tax=Pseudo-nitzschia multistriata TaxID=183589 RepID=A0A448ZQ33_9STRA|nr:unnamed protein product [Pseudo-nitzschia multistriata]